MKKIMTLAIIALAGVVMVACSGQPKQKTGACGEPCCQPKVECAECPAKAECPKVNAEAPQQVECPQAKAADCPQQPACTQGKGECPKAVDCPKAAECPAAKK